MKNEITIAQFIAANGITMTAKRTATNRNMERSAEMDNWLCTMKMPAPALGVAGSNPFACVTMRVPYSMGKGLKGEAPDLADVLGCLALDANFGEQSFAGFCSDCGYSEDSREAYRIFRVIKRQTAKLKAFIAEAEQFETLIHATQEL